MLGFWEFMIIGGLISWAIFSYVRKKNLVQNLPNKKEKREIIDLDEDSYEVIDDNSK